MGSNVDEFPIEIKMSGLPIFLAGWNSVLKRTDEIRDKCPVYVLQPYFMYYCIYVPMIEIYRNNGR